MIIIDNQLKSNVSIKESIKAMVGETLGLGTTVISTTKIITVSALSNLLDDTDLDVRYNPENGLLQQSTKH